MRQIFRKVPLSEKKVIFKEGSQTKLVFYVKGRAEDLVTMYLDEYVDGKVLTFNVAPGSPTLLSHENVVVNFTYGEDRYFFQTRVDVYGSRVHIQADLDVYILQRRKTPRLDIPKNYPGGLNIISYHGKAVLYNCLLLDFSSGGCRVVYAGHLPAFKTGEILRAVIHLNHRKPVEVDAEVKHHIADTAAGTQEFGLQFKLPTSILENRLLVVFMDLQRELFIKWSSDDSD